MNYMSHKATKFMCMKHSNSQHQSNESKKSALYPRSIGKVEMYWQWKCNTKQKPCSVLWCLKYYLLHFKQKCLQISAHCKQLKDKATLEEIPYNIRGITSRLVASIRATYRGFTLWTPDYSRINLWLIHMGVWQIGEMHNLEQSKDY